MAINLITQPGATTPIGNDDYTQQNLLINGVMAQGDEVLTDWADTITEPSIAQGTYFYHSGNSYQVQDSDSSISGTPVSGANYIGLAESGGVLTASYITDISGYTWNPAYNGLYDGTTLIIRAVTYLIGSAYHRALGADKAQSGMFILPDGSFVSSAGQFNLGDKDIITTGDISCDDITGGNIISNSVTSGSSSLKWKTFTGTTDNNGDATVPHGITGTIIGISGGIFVSGNSGQWYSIGYFNDIASPYGEIYGGHNGSNISIYSTATGGGSTFENATYRIIAFYI